jgi:hypothetical protein
MWIAWLRRRLPQRQPVDLSVAGGHLDRGGAVVGGEMAAAGEPGHAGDVADDGAGDHRADTENLGERGARCLTAAASFVAPLGIEAAQVGHELRRPWRSTAGASACWPSTRPPLIRQPKTSQPEAVLHDRRRPLTLMIVRGLSAGCGGDLGVTPGPAGVTWRADRSGRQDPWAYQVSPQQ